MIKKKLTYIILAISLLASSTSCNKWLDVQPNSQIKASELFETEAGFKEALAGVYTILGDEDIYGGTLTFGMMGVLSHEWTNYSSSYNDDAAYNYLASNTQTRIENVWSNMYKAISNANSILENIEGKNIFTGNNYAIIKGEALALRAFIHFDLLRCFGVSFATNANQQAIPYVTRYSSNQTVQSSVAEVTSKILEDLLQAKELLKKDPIYTGETVTEYNDNGYLINRQLHLNYYAVEGLLARIYLYKGDYEKARLYAQSVVDADAFSFTPQQDFIDGKDLSGASEHLFALQITGLQESAIEHLSTEGTVGPIFSLTNIMLSSYYENNTYDYRFEYLFEIGTGANASNSYILKYNESSSDESYYNNKMPIIKLAEMYYILAECDNHDNVSPLDNMNVVRKARGLSDFTSLVDFRTTMNSEFRKEFIGEGQLFFYYKRINQAYIPNSDANLIETKGYTFPIPDSEYTAANRSNNR